MSRQEFDPWGSIRSGGISQTTINYTGQRRDGTGLLYYHARYYDPALSRFISADTIVPGSGALTLWPSDATAAPLFAQANAPGPQNPQELNRYSYVNNNPVRHTDSTGHLIDTILDVGFIAYGIYDIAAHGYTAEKGLALAADVGSALLPGVTGGGMAVRALAHADDVADLATKGGKAAGSVIGTYGDLKKANVKDAHHIIQDAAVKDIKGYSTKDAPAIQLPGPSTRKGTPHYNATRVQEQRGGGTYAAERRIGYKALRKAGLSKAESRNAIAWADQYFDSIGVTATTKTRAVRNRH